MTKRTGLNALSIAVGLGIWWLASRLRLLDSTVFPSPGEVLQTGWEMVRDLSLFFHIWTSLVRVLLGFLLAVAVALPLGVAMGLWDPLRRAVDPIVELLRPIPPLAFIPLAILWFGIGQASKVVAIAYAAFFPILVQTVAGFKAVEPIHILAAQTLGAGRRQILGNVILWAAFADVLVGVRLGMGMAFFMVVAAELIASSSGLGWLIWDARFHFMSDRIVLGMAAIGALGFGLNRALVALEGRLVRWRPAGAAQVSITAL